MSIGKLANILTFSMQLKAPTLKSQIDGWGGYNRGDYWKFPNEWGAWNSWGGWIISLVVML